MVDLWRGWVEEKAGTDMDGLLSKLEDQNAFARVVRDMLASMQMAEELAEEEQSEDSDDSEENQPQGEERSEEGGEEDSGSDQSPTEDQEASSEEEQAGESGPPQRPAPHRLQVRRCTLAARPAQSRPDDARGPAQGEYRRRGFALGA